LGMSPLLSEDYLSRHLSARGQLGQDYIALGATTVCRTAYLLDDDHRKDVSEERGVLDFDSEEGCDRLFQDSVRGEVDLDAFMVSAAHARPKMDVDAEHLSKI
jgi:hypothetical protein